MTAEVIVSSFFTFFGSRSDVSVWFCGCGGICDGGSDGVCFIFSSHSFDDGLSDFSVLFGGCGGIRDTGSDGYLFFTVVFVTAEVMPLIFIWWQWDLLMI